MLQLGLFLSRLPYTIDCIAARSGAICTRGTISRTARRSYSEQPSEADREAKRFLQAFSRAAIPKDSCRITFSRSSGPGGQNSNKLNTKVTLRLPRSDQGWIPATILERLRDTNSHHPTKEGDLLITSQRSRTQEQNREDAYQKLASLLTDAAKAGVVGETSQATQQRVSKLIRRENEVRIKQKKMHASKKKARRAGPGDE